jgi:hypothetical protein
MAYRSTVFGFIEGIYISRHFCRVCHAVNENALNALPLEDSYPFLNRAMFVAPALDAANSHQLIARSPIIHFGCSAKNLELGDVPAWLVKFEALLSTMHWEAAEVHMLTELMGRYAFRWDAASTVFDAYREGMALPTTAWTKTQFLGEPPLVE